MDIVDMMRRSGIVAVTVVAALAVAGLVYLHERSQKLPGEAQIAPQVSCLSPGMFPDRFPPPMAQSFTPPSTGTVPEGFKPVAVVACEPVSTSTYFDASGMPAGTTEVVDEVKREGDLTDLLAALSDDSDPQGWWIEAWFGATRAPSGGTGCAPGSTCRMLWLVDSDGRAIRPWVPLDRSGSPKSAAREAIERLPVVDRTSHDLQVPSARP